MPENKVWDSHICRFQIVEGESETVLFANGEDILHSWSVDDLLQFIIDRNTGYAPWDDAGEQGDRILPWSQWTEV